MSFKFYDNLPNSQKNRYDLMLETNYILLRCDEWYFIETDENEVDSMSVSWIQSIQHSLELFGLPHQSYPQGSISANRHYYEALRNYFGSSFPNTLDINYLRKALLNFLRLRCDDSSANRSYQFGSYFEVISSSGVRDPRKYRRVEINQRHSASALWILLEESSGTLSYILKESLVSFLHRTKRYLSKNQDWFLDRYRHLTVACTIKVCRSILDKITDKIIVEMAKEIKDKCEESIFQDELLDQDLSGEYEWKLPDTTESKMAVYEYYLNSFVLNQVPELLRNQKAQSIIRGMITNKVSINTGYGIPIHKLTGFPSYEMAKPDFGATASVLYLLWYIIENNIGESKWVEYCIKHFNWLIQGCLNMYDKGENYILPHSENNTKILLMPRYNFDQNRADETTSYIFKLKNVIKNEMEHNTEKLSKSLNNIDAPKGLEHVKDILEIWKINEYWKQPKGWILGADWGKVGEFVGGFIVQGLKSATST